jgi:hypothetical protein
MENTTTVFLTFLDIMDFALSGDLYDSYFIEEIPILFGLLSKNEYDAHAIDITKIKEAVSTYVKSFKGTERNVDRSVLIVFPSLYADNVRSTLRQFRRKKEVNSVRDAIEFLVRELNNKTIKDREDVITDLFIDFQVHCQNCLTVSMCNSTDMLVAKEINSVLEHNNWNFERNTFFRKPDAKKIAMDVKTVENYYSIPKITIHEDEPLAKEILRIMNVKIVYSSKLEFMRNMRTTLLTPILAKYKNEPITQTLFRSYIKYGYYDSDANYNDDLVDMSFIRENYIKKRYVSCTNDNLFEQVFYMVEKLKEDDPVADVISNLIVTLRKDRMGSSLTPYILEYEVLIEDFQSNNKQVCKIIKLTLYKHGWAGKTKGFQTEPNRKKLVEDLEKVVKPYFEVVTSEG